jgi:hypothetical protein
MDVKIIVYSILTLLNVVLAGMFLATGGTLLTIIAGLLIVIVFLTMRQRTWGIAFLVYFGWKMLLMPGWAPKLIYSIMVASMGLSLSKSFNAPVSKFFMDSPKRTNYILAGLLVIAVIIQVVNLSVPPDLMLKTELVDLDDTFIIGVEVFDIEGNSQIPTHGLTWVLYSGEEAVESDYVSDFTTNEYSIILTEPGDFVRIIIRDENNRELVEEVLLK